MEKQDPLNLQVQQFPSNKVWLLNDFYEYIHIKNPLLINRKYFTQLDLISDYAHILSQFSLTILQKERSFQFQTKKQEVDEEYHVLLIKLSSNNLELTFKILMIQMDKIIKVDMKYFDQQTGKFITLDSFWFNHSLYLNQKISNTYKLISIKQMDPKTSNLKTQFNCLFIARILSSFAQKAPQIQFKVNKISQEAESEIKHVKMITHFENLKFFNISKSCLLAKDFYETLGSGQNMLKICSFLSIKQIVRLKLVSQFIKKYLIESQRVLFKQLYEYNYGKTGFDINQMNWSKLLDKKRGENKSKYKGNSPLMINQGIFRTH